MDALGHRLRQPLLPAIPVLLGVAAGQEAQAMVPAVPRVLAATAERGVRQHGRQAAER
ncbi:hypothetical protein [Streptomyces tubercidicus]|uniref:hypothetical protein n=1 Tax=Streptomyces tubercidicus TaxID=47759 RepID=UPI003465B621